jgi:hypothetical protein
VSYNGRVCACAQPTSARVAALQLKLPCQTCCHAVTVLFRCCRTDHERVRSNEHAVFTHKQSLCIGQAYREVLHGLVLSKTDCRPSCVSGRSHQSSTFQPLYGSAVVAMSDSKPGRLYVCVRSVRTASFVMVGYLEPFRPTMEPFPCVSN